MTVTTDSVQPAGEEFRVEPDYFWDLGKLSGGNGYDLMTPAIGHGWKPIPSWGSDGWDLGGWPLILVYFRDINGAAELAVVTEGDTAQYSFPTKEARNAHTDVVAFDCWKREEEDWVKGFETVDDLPGYLRGPNSRSRTDSPNQSVGL